MLKTVAIAIIVAAGPAAADRLSHSECIATLAQAYDFRDRLMDGYVSVGGSGRNSPEASTALVIAVNRFLPVIRDLGDACELIRQEEIAAWEKMQGNEKP